MNNRLDLRNSELSIPWFPTKMQAFIFRNWNMADKSRIARILNTSTENVEREASRMGLQEQADTSAWAEKGYITIIRSNWHLLPTEQLLELLNWQEDELERVLKQEDFLKTKLGKKVDCKRITYRELTENEEKQTEKIKKAMEELRGISPEGKIAPFEFKYSESVVQKKSAPSAQQITLDNNYHVTNYTQSKNVDCMISRFEQNMEELWEIKPGDGNFEITLSFLEEIEEYHEIFIEEGKIEIKAGGEAGILRALYRLEDLMQASGGPFLNPGTYIRKPRFGIRYIYPFSGLFDQAFDTESIRYCPDSLLEEYAKIGVNGIWLPAVLYRLTRCPFAPELSEGWELRQKNLLDFINRAKLYGIKIYLYINEPRTLPLSVFEKYPAIKGAVRKTCACMCVSEPQTEEYLKNAIKELCSAAPGLGGFFTITMSENVTHCKSMDESMFVKACLKCTDIPPWKLAAKVNKIINDAAHSVDSRIKVIAWDWGWREDLGFREGDAEKVIKSLSPEVAIMCNRDRNIKFTRGGISGSVRDYSISVEGISEQSINHWKCALQNGHETVAKLQINNSWECSSTPYLPVYRTLFKHIKAISEAGVNHLMLSWTLGGYPSPSIRMISEILFAENGKSPDFDRVLSNIYGDKAEIVKQATDFFCDGFSEFPFDVRVLYFGPQNGGVSNPLYNEPTGFEATMTCYSFDDLEKWRSIYPVETLEQQFKKVSDSWEQGVTLLKNELKELYDIAYVSYSLFRSSYNQIRFIRLRDRYAEDKSEELAREITKIIQSERELTVGVYQIMCTRPEVGFEAANHYYYSLYNVMEKIINCDWLIDYYKSK